MAPIAKPRTATTVNDYTVVPLSIPPTESFPQPTTHYLYLRPHSPKVPTDDTPREVFVVNLPIDSTEAHIRSLFAEQLGGARIDTVDFEGARTGKKITAPVTSKGASRKRKRGVEAVVDLPTTWDREVRPSGITAVVRFVDVASAEVAIAAAKKVKKGGCAWKVAEGKVPALGIARYVKHHSLRFPSAATLQSSIDAYMTGFAEQEAARAKALARQRAVPDEDGFITVTRGGRAGPARQEEAEEKARKEKERKVGEDDFYRFQKREVQKEGQRRLLQGFQEDRKKLDELRKQRRFRPN